MDLSSVSTIDYRQEMKTFAFSPDGQAITYISVNDRSAEDKEEGREG